MSEIRYERDADVSHEELNGLFETSWPRHVETDFTPFHDHGLAYVCAFAGDRLVGYVRMAWDGGQHAFLLEPTVHPGYRRRGIGAELVRRSVEVSKERGLEWLHVDFEPALREFYAACGFRPTDAGLIRLS